MVKDILSELSLALDIPFAVPDAQNYRPPTWPPPDDWPIIIDAAGQIVSRWGDPIWRLDPWAGKRVTLNFGDGPPSKRVASIDPANARLLRIATGWWIYGPNGSPGVRSLKTRFDQLRCLFVLCSEEGISASDLNIFPRVVDLLASIAPRSRSGEFLALLHELYERRDVLGITLLDRTGLARLAASIPKHETAQTPYIPPRIWHYQVTRLRECLDDFLAHRTRIEECFRFCLEAYHHNGGVQARTYGRQPFRWHADGSNGKFTGSKYHGPFRETLQRFGLMELFERWLWLNEGSISVVALSHYLTLVSRAGLAYVLNFSLMRVEEAWNLTSDCLQIEHDPQFGDIHILRGRTTKTMTDPEALWVASPSVKVAIDSMQAISVLRSECSKLMKKDCASDQTLPPYLIDYVPDPWHPKRLPTNNKLRPYIVSYSSAFRSRNKLFDLEKLRITPEDLELARLVTPTLTSEFAVGKPWPLAWHQLRRTGAVNMQASGLVSDASLQFQLKHVVKAMSLYYGQNHSRVRLEERAHTYYVRTMYETLGRQLQQITSSRFVSPHGEKRKSEIVRLISVSDLKKASALAKKGLAAHRPVLLGVCTSRTPCPYGGIDNIARCGGGDSPVEMKPCADVLYDAEQQQEIEALEILLDDRLSTAEPNSPLKDSLEAQKRSLENYRDVIRRESSH